MEGDTLKGTYGRTKFHWTDPSKPDGFLGITTDGCEVRGQVVADELPVPGQDYIFYGQWKESPQYGRQFHCTLYSVQMPSTRKGTLLYLTRYCAGIGEGLSNRLFDAYGKDAIAMLRQSPAEVAAHPRIRKYLSLNDATLAAGVLQQMAEYEEQRVALILLFSGHGFPWNTVEACIQRWKEKAYAFVQIDPFRMMVAGLPGCGFSRCDALYQRLQLPLYRIKRQMLAIWYSCKSNMNGDTWIHAGHAANFVREKVTVDESQFKIAQAIEMGVKTKWLAKHTDKNGIDWIACYEDAEAERMLAYDVVRVNRWKVGDDMTSLKMAIEAAQQKKFAQTRDANDDPANNPIAI